MSIAFIRLEQQMFSSYDPFILTWPLKLQVSIRNIIFFFLTTVQNLSCYSMEVRKKKKKTDIFMLVKEDLFSGGHNLVCE